MKNWKIGLARYIRLIKQGLTDYRWLLFYIQRMDYNPNHRKFVSSLIAKFLPKTPDRQLTDEAKKLSETLKEDGYVVLEDFANKIQVEEMRSYLATKLCFDPDRPEMGKFSSPDLAPKPSIHAYYTPEDAVGIPHLWELANDPKILSIIEDRFGSKPTISLLYVWWLLYGFDAEANADHYYVKRPVEFHRDIDDWKQIRLYICLTDVDENVGPHTFIKSSHKWVLPPKVREIDLDNPDFPMRDNLVQLTGEAGMAWLGDTYVLHRGTIPTKQHRLMLTVTYTFFPEPHAPNVPLLPCPDPNRFDPYINRVYLKYK
jgi:Phytanoyl-CoA dioxygenase (PhyH)